MPAIVTERECGLLHDVTEGPRHVMRRLAVDEAAQPDTSTRTGTWCRPAKLVGPAWGGGECKGLPVGGRPRGGFLPSQGLGPCESRNHDNVREFSAQLGVLLTSHSLLYEAKIADDPILSINKTGWEIDKMPIDKALIYQHGLRST